MKCFWPGKLLTSMDIIYCVFRTSDYFPSDRLPSSIYVEAKSPIGEDLREDVKKFRPLQRLRLVSLKPGVKTPLFKRIKY